MPFDYEQLKQIAATIRGYEQPAPIYASARELRLTNGPGLPALVTNAFIARTADTKLNWATLLMLGVVPTTAAEHETAPPYAPEKCHTLDFVAAFADHPPIHDYFLRRFERLLASEDASDRVITKQGNLIPPPRHAKRFNHVHGQHFRTYHAAWYTPRALTKLAREQLTYRGHIAGFLCDIAISLERAGEDISILQEIATEAVVGVLKEKPTSSTDYVNLAQAIQLADAREIYDQLRKRTGSVLQMLLITLPNAPPDAMVAGLKALAGTRQTEILAYLGRVPTAEELLAANVKGAGLIWRTMPWELLQPTVASDGEALRAGLLKRSELSFEELQKCFIDHLQRYTRQRAPRELRQIQDAEARYANLAEHLKQFDIAKRAEEVLRASYVDEDVRWLVAFRHIAMRDDLRVYLEPHLTEEVKAALTSWRAPVVRRSGGYYEIDPIKKYDDQGL